MSRHASGLSPVRVAIAAWAGNLVRDAVFRSALWTIVFKVVAAGLAFVASLLYARTLGPAGYGQFAYVITIASFLAIPASLGLGPYLVSISGSASGQLPALKRWADKWTLWGGLVAALVLVVCAIMPAFAAYQSLLLGAACLPLLNNLAGIRQALLQCAGRMAVSQWPSLVLMPLVIVLVLFACHATGTPLTPLLVLYLTIGAAMLPLLINTWSCKSALGTAPAGALSSVALTRALPFVWLNGLYLINSRADLIMLGSMSGAYEAGVYTVAVRATELLSFFMIAANTAIAPQVSKLFYLNDHAALQRLISRVSVGVAVVGVPVCVFLFLWADDLLRIFYGHEFSAGALVIKILVVSQLFNVLCGPVGILLNMTKYASLSAKTFAFGATVNVLLNFLLIPLYGGTGAAVATAVSMSLCGALRWYLVRKYLSLRPSCFGV